MATVSTDDGANVQGTPAQEDRGREVQLPPAVDRRKRARCLQHLDNHRGSGQEAGHVLQQAYITPKANPIYARYRFNEKMQGESESFEQFITELKLLVKDCVYPNDFSDEIVRVRIVFATNSKNFFARELT